MIWSSFVVDGFRIKDLYLKIASEMFPKDKIQRFSVKQKGESPFGPHSESRWESSPVGFHFVVRFSEGRTGIQSVTEQTLGQWASWAWR